MVDKVIYMSAFMDINTEECHIISVYPTHLSLFTTIKAKCLQMSPTRNHNPTK